MIEAQTESNTKQRLASVAGARMANRDTPFIRNAWYFAALSSEVTRSMLARQYLGISTVLFRKEDGTAVAMQDRCCHRSFPLSQGKLDGDILECGYHGFRYDCTGKCVAVPSQQKIPERIRVRSFPVIEKDPFIWIWMGDAALADPSLCPGQEYAGNPEWALNIGRLDINSSYVYLLENLLDLSHLSFVHDKTFGTPEYARAPIEENISDTHIEIWRHVECKLPAVFANPLGWQGDTAKRSSQGLFVTPGLIINTARLKNLSAPEKNPAIQPTVYTEELVTPVTRDSTQYYYALYRNFAIDDAKTGEFMLKSIATAFNEDAVVLQRITDMLNCDETPDFFEIDVAADKPGVYMRRRLKMLAELEQQNV